MAPGPDDEFEPRPAGDLAGADGGDQAAVDDDVADQDLLDDDIDDHGAVDEGIGDESAGEPSTALPPRLEAWRRRSAAGAIMTGLARGLQQVFEKEQEQPAIIMTTSGDPPKDLPVEAEVEQGRPRQSVVSIRPWLLDKPAPAPESSPDDGSEKDD